MVLRGTLACSVTASLFLSAGTASAQSAEGDSQTEEPSTPADQPSREIVVTAQKRSERLQDVAGAISVLDGDTLTDLGVSNLAEITNITTGLAVAPIRSRANIYIRGVGQSLASPNADSNIALNLNGVYLPGQMASPAFFDVEQIEVLAGPQGTLYGRNSTGGVVNIISRRPQRHFAADGFAEVGNYDHFQIMLGVDVPLSGNLYSRTSATHDRHDGYISNGEDDQRTTAVRETLMWEPSASTTVTAVGTYTHEGGIGNVLINVPDLDCGLRCASFDPKALGYYYDVDIFQGSLLVEQNLNDAVTLSYIGGYSHLDQRSFNALFSGPPHAALLNPETAEIQSHELRANIHVSRFEGLLGAYYFDEKGFVGVRIMPTPAVLLDNPFHVKSHGAALFGQGTVDLLDDLRFTAGLRYSNTVKAIDGTNFAFTPAGAQIFARPYEGRLSMDRIDWKAGLEFDVDPDAMIYANVASGFTPGGFSSGPQVLGQTAAKRFDPVTLVSYAVGLKSSFAADTVVLNAEAFYYDYKNYQISARDIVTAQNLVYNAKKSTIYGLQVDTSFLPSRNDDLTVSATYLHAKADILNTPSGSFNGIDLPFSPRWTIHARYERSFDLSDGGQLRASVNFKYTSGRWTLYTQNSDTYFQERNTHTDLNLGYYAAQDRWYLEAFVRNLEDDLVKTACIASIPGPAACYFEAPRTYGLQLGWKI